MEHMSAWKGRDPGREMWRDPGEGTQLLVSRLKDGDPAALRDLFQQEGKRAFALALRIVSDRAVAEDAVQEAFTQLWERADRISLEGGRIESLLMTIVRRRAVDLARRRSRTEKSLPESDLIQEIDERAAETLERVEESMTAEGLRAELNAALAALPHEQREIVNYAYYGEHTLREIAEREGLPLGTVKSRLRLAIAKLS